MKEPFTNTGRRMPFFYKISLLYIFYRGAVLVTLIFLMVACTWQFERYM